MCDNQLSMIHYLGIPQYYSEISIISPVNDHYYIINNQYSDMYIPDINVNF